MYGHTQSIASYRETRQAAVDDPHRVIELLLTGFMERLTRAQGCLERGDISGKAIALHNCIEILEGLRMSLDHEAGGELSRNLEALYEYAGTRLLEANAENDLGKMQEVAGLIGKIESAWIEIGPEVSRGSHHG